jgi:transcriptional regulator with XRE-family HTH domain
MPSTNGNTFGERLFALRKQRAWSQRELAERIGTSAPIIGRYERGEIAPSIEVAAKLAEALDASLDYLAGLSEQAQLNSQMLERLDAIERLAEEEREHVFFTLDAMLRDARARRAYAA